MPRAETIQSILSFWFGDAQDGSDTYKQRRKLWFSKNSEVDQSIRDRFLPVYQQAIAGELEEWITTPEGCLALILLFDQFPRNMFRGQPEAFATDSKALAIAEHTVAQRFDQQLNPLQRLFIYLPFEHSESITCQQRSVALFQQLGEENPELADAFDYALRHKAVIERFGRFPHRNVILGRETTPEEAEFLKQPGSSF